MSSFRWGMIACPTPTNSQVTGWELRQPPVFLSLKDCHSLQPQKHVSTIWYLIQSLLGADQASIPHLKEEIVSFQGMQKNWNFLINRYNLSQVKMTLFQHGVSCSHLYQHTLTLWSVTMQPLAADLPTIPHMKGDIHIFHLRYGSMICTKRLQSYGGCKLYARTSLVCL